MSSSCDVLLTSSVSYRQLEPRPWRFPSWLVTRSWPKWQYGHIDVHATLLQGHTEEFTIFMVSLSELYWDFLGASAKHEIRVAEGRGVYARGKICRSWTMVTLKNMAELRFAFLTVNVRSVILCDAASCSVQKCTIFRIIMLPFSSGLVNDFCQPDILTARHYIPDTILHVS